MIFSFSFLEDFLDGSMFELCIFQSIKKVIVSLHLAHFQIGHSSFSILSKLLLLFSHSPLHISSYVYIYWSLHQMFPEFVQHAYHKDIVLTPTQRETYPCFAVHPILFINMPPFGVSAFHHLLLLFYLETFGERHPRTGPIPYHNNKRPRTNSIT